MGEHRTPVLTRHGAGVAPLSFGQQRLWVIDRAAPGSATYNVPLLVRWREPVEAAAWCEALRAVVARHAVLRTTYHLRDGEPVQVVADPGAPVPVRVIDLAGAPDGWDQVRAQADRYAREPFDLAGDPPLRCVVWRGVPGGDALLLSVHHIAIDGWSLAVLFEDLAAAYGAALAGDHGPLPDLPVQYADYAVWERGAVADPAVDRLVAERVDDLRGTDPVLRLAGARESPAMPDGARRGAQHTFTVPEAVRGAVADLARTARATPFVVYFAAYQEVLRRWSGRADFVVGLVTAHRPHPDLERLVGFFVNTVPVRCRPTATGSFTRLCGAARTEAYRALTYQRIPLDRLTAAAAARHGHTDLATVGFAMQNMPAPALRQPRWLPPRVLPTGTAKFDLLLILEDVGGDLVGTVEYDTDRYPAGTGRRFGASYVTLLGAAVADSESPLADLPVPDVPHPPARTAPPPPPPRADVPAAPEPEALRAAADLFAAALAEVAVRPRDLGAGANFFGLGGHSLLAVTMLARAESRHGVPLPPRDFLADPTVGGLARLLAAPVPPTAPDAPPVDPGGSHPATGTQQRFWFLDRIPQLRSAYLVPTVVELTGPVQHRALRDAVDAVLARHPALRSRFTLQRRQRRVSYRTDGPPAVTVLTDASTWDARRLADHLASVCWAPCDLARDAPARAEILAADGRTLLVLVTHHIISDGWSRELLMDQVAAAYRAALEGRAAMLADPVHPAEVAPGPAGGTAEVVERLRGAPVDVRLPHDRPRGDVQSTVAGTRVATVGAAGLRAAAGESGCTTFMCCAALLGVGLARRTGQRDLLVAFPWAGRSGPRAAGAVGLFVNTLVLRVDLRGAPTWRELLARVREGSLSCYRHADVPLDEVAAVLHPDRDLSRPPLTPVYLSVPDAAEVPPVLHPSLTARYLPLDPLHIKYELEFTATPCGDDLELAASYSADLFDASTVDDLLGAVADAAADLTTDPLAHPL